MTITIKDLAAKLDLAKKGPKRELVPFRPTGYTQCRECSGQGFYSYNVAYDHPQFGKVYPCEACNAPNYAAYSGLSSDELLLAWAEIEDWGNARQVAAKVQEVLERGYGWIYLWGGPGRAKSLILKTAIAQTVGRGANYTSMTAILNDLRESFDQEYPNSAIMSRLAKWKSVPVLAVDEVDKVKLTEFVAERRFDILDERHVEALRERSITLFAANSAPDQGFDDWTRSRFEDGRMLVIELTGEDMRPAMLWDANGVAQREEAE
jgi:chromosomal replication initiation ATPase DnaA